MIKRGGCKGLISLLNKERGRRGQGEGKGKGIPPNGTTSSKQPVPQKKRARIPLWSVKINTQG